ncbi:DegT/DnrJ/EryC1/StrS family aminotransferase [Deltaproteobacteria bacterium TL4]
MTNIPIFNGTNGTLAMEGGTPVRSTPMPPRYAMGIEETAMIAEVLEFYKQRNLDPGYQGVFEERYCEAFCSMMGGGFADAVATGTASLFIALAALNLPKGSEVLVSPITDPGTLSAIILNGLVPRLVDSQPGNYNIGAKEVQERITPQVSCVLVVHSLGQAAEIDAIVDMAHSLDIKVLEDCSQAHGAMYKGQRVGTFGDIAAFSTMYRKASITGSSGGVVFTKNEELYHQSLAHADRGKPRWRSDFDDRNPSQYLFPALNFHTDEISCAIGLASLNRLDETRKLRLDFVAAVSKEIKQVSKVCQPYGYSLNDSPFIYPVVVHAESISVDKTTFAKAILTEGIGLNPHYAYLVSDWHWILSYLSDRFDTQNARNIRDKTFNLYLNENYGYQEVVDTVTALIKVEKVYCK